MSPPGRLCCKSPKIRLSRRFFREPLLARAKTVEVVIVTGGPGKSDEVAGADIAHHLARHGLKVEVERLVARDIDITSTILSSTRRRYRRRSHRHGRLWPFALARIRSRRRDAGNPGLDDGAGFDVALTAGVRPPPCGSPRAAGPAECIGARKEPIEGNPDPKHISTSFAERSNLNVRMHTRRFTRLTNAFSKKIENHAHSVALFALYYDFVRIHKTLRTTPAMAQGSHRVFGK